MTFSFLFLCGDKFNAQTNLVRAFISFLRCIEICLNSNVPTECQQVWRARSGKIVIRQNPFHASNVYFSRFLVFIKSFWVEPNGIWIGVASPPAQPKARFILTMIIIIIMVPDSPASTYKWQNVGKWCARHHFEWIHMFCGNQHGYKLMRFLSRDSRLCPVRRKQ